MMKKRTEDLLDLVNEYGEWIANYRKLRESLENMKRYYLTEMEDKNDASSDEFILVEMIYDISKDLCFTSDDPNTSLGDLKRWFRDDIDFIRRELKVKVEEESYKIISDRIKLKNK